jgi:hypothetical protein
LPLQIQGIGSDILSLSENGSYGLWTAIPSREEEDEEDNKIDMVRTELHDSKSPIRCAMDIPNRKKTGFDSAVLGREDGSVTMVSLHSNPVVIVPAPHEKPLDPLDMVNDANEPVLQLLLLSNRRCLVLYRSSLRLIALPPASVLEGDISARRSELLATFVPTPPRRSNNVASPTSETKRSDVRSPGATVASNASGYDPVPTSSTLATSIRHSKRDSTTLRHGGANADWLATATSGHITDAANSIGLGSMHLWPMKLPGGSMVDGVVVSTSDGRLIFLSAHDTLQPVAYGHEKAEIQCDIPSFFMTHSLRTEVRCFGAALGARHVFESTRPSVLPASAFQSGQQTNRPNSATRYWAIRSVVLLPVRPPLTLASVTEEKVTSNFKLGPAALDGLGMDGLAPLVASPSAAAAMSSPLVGRSSSGSHSHTLGSPSSRSTDPAAVHLVCHPFVQCSIHSIHGCFLFCPIGDQSENVVMQRKRILNNSITFSSNCKYCYYLSFN